jgi:signal transduction histidine kinase
LTNDSVHRDTGLEAIKRLSSKVRKARTDKEGYQVICMDLKEMFDADYAAIALVDPATSKLRVAGFYGVSESVRPCLEGRFDFELRESLTRTHEPSAARFDSIEDIPVMAKDVAKALDIGSVIISTLLMRDELLGYAIIARKKGRAPFPPEAKEALVSISDYFGVVVDHIVASGSIRAAKHETDRMLALAPIGIFICDPKGIFLSVNNQMLKMLDRNSEQELIGTSVFELPVIMKSGLDALIVQGMEGHEGEKVDAHIVLRPDKAYYLHAKMVPIRSESGAIERMMFVAMDVSTKIRLQDQLERSYEKLTQTYQELERVTKMKTQFIDIVSHELRTPLTVMRGYIDLVESEYASKLEPKFASRLGIIKVNTDRLYSLVESMLDVSRLEKGSLQIHPEPVKIDTILDDIVNSKMKDAEAKKQAMSLDIEGKLPLIMADRRRMKDVFSNIIDNAIRYTQDGGRIQIGARDEGRILHVWVKDNGVGIPLENLGKIFDRFHIVTSNELSHQVDRLGLGLPISKGIVEAHGGRIWVESQVGKGSVFHVDLPKESSK